MDFSLNEEQVLLRDSAREFLGQEWPSAELRRMLDAADGAVAAGALWSKMSDLGWPGLLVSEDYDGLGLGMFDLAVLMEETGAALIPGTLHASGLLAASALEALADEDSCQKYLPDIAEGKLKATVGIYEPGSGWTPMMLAPEAGEAVTKRYVPDAASADLILFVNRTGGNGAQIAIAHESQAEDLNSIDVTRSLSQVTCAADKLEVLGEGTIADVQAVIDRATIGLSAELIGGSARVLNMTVEYVKNRKQFGRAVGTFQAVQHKAADMLIGIEKGRTGVYYAAAVADERPDDLARAASVAKATANQTAVSVGELGIQLHGGLGFTWEQDLHLYLKRAKAAEFTYGDTRWHLDRIAHGLGLS